MYLHNRNRWRNDWLELLSHFTQWYQGKIFQNCSYWTFFYSSHIHKRKKKLLYKVNLHTYVQSELPQKSKKKKNFFYVLGTYCLQKRDLSPVTLGILYFSSQKIMVDKIIKRRNKYKIYLCGGSEGGVCVYTYLTYTLIRHKFIT